MDPKEDREIQLQNSQPPEDSFLIDVLEGLKKRQKEIPPKYFYDERGSNLFQCICTLDEYYIPKIETSIIEENIKEITDIIGEDVLLIEYGCGDCTKTRILLDNLKNPAAFIPVDISEGQLMSVAKSLSEDYTGLEVLPVCADYTAEFSLPISSQSNNRRVVYFPGSSIGNFEPDALNNFLASIARVCGSGGILLIGIDLKKDPGVLNDAYNDNQGLTAEFNMNLLTRINRELGADFQLENFDHKAFYNQKEGRVEMHLVSLKNQVVHIDDRAIPFCKGETIWTENSYKYSIDAFASIAKSAGFKVRKTWTDKKQWFCVQCLLSDK